MSGLSLLSAAKPCLKSLSVALVLAASAGMARATAATTTTTLAVTSGGSAVATVASLSVVTLTAMVKAGTTAVPLGVVNFCDATAAHCEDISIVGTAQLTATGVATYRFRPGLGSHSYKAVFVGTGTNAASTSVAAKLTVTGKAPTTSVIAQSGIEGDYTLTATVSSVGTATPTGTVTFQDVSNGSAAVGTASLGAGTSGLSFVSPTSLSMENGGFLVVGDFNNDGIPDGVAPSADQRGVTFYAGNGDGTFTIGPESRLIGLDLEAAVAGDFNGDGILDVAILIYSTSQGVLLLGNGDGTFSEGEPFGTVKQPNAMVVGDFNGDGALDIVVAGNGGGDTLKESVVSLGNGKGGFTGVQGPSPTDGYLIDGLAAGDFNGDGHLDLVTVNRAAGNALILLGNGDGTFNPVAQSPGNGQDYGPNVVADFNGDGKPDLAMPSASGLGIFLGNGDGTFTEGSQYSTITTSQQLLVIGDFNGDGKADIAVETPSGMTVLLGNGNGAFAPVAANPAGCTYFDPMTAVDLNGDGITDLLGYGCASGALIAANSTARASKSGVSFPFDSGLHQVNASYAGDSGYLPSTSYTTALEADGTANISVTQTPTTFTYGSLVKFTVTITGSSIVPTGTVGLLAGTTPLCVGKLNASGVASCSAAAFQTNTVTVKYSGDKNYNPTTYGYYTSWKLATPKLTATSTSASITLGQAITLSTTVDRVGGGVAPSGNVIFFSTPQYLQCHETLNSAGSASCATTPAVAGAFSFYADYAGDSHYGVAGSPLVNVTVNPGTPTVSLTSTTQAPAVGTVVTLTAMVPGLTATVPTGSITFLDGGNSIGVIRLGTTGVAALTTSSLAKGTHSITASYSGDANYTAAVSTALVETVVNPYATAPVITPKSETHIAPIGVTLTDAMAGTTMYYTVNGTAPTSASTRYTGAITVTSTETIEAIAVATGYTQSPVSSATFTIEPLSATPVFVTAPGTYSGAQTIFLSDATAGATMYYAVHGVVPTTASTQYTRPIAVAASETIKVIAVAPGYGQSAVASGTYTIK